MKTLSASALLLLIILLNIHCGHHHPNPSLPPNIFYLQVTKDHVPISDSFICASKLYYYNNEGLKKDRLSATSDDTTFISLPGRFIKGLDNKGVIASGYLSGIISDGYHNVYLQFPDGDIDTLYVEVDNLEYEEAIKNSCYCVAPFTHVQVNGKDLQASTEILSADGKPVFVFEK